MARPSSNMIYYKKAFENARRCLAEARKESHPSARFVTKLKNPKTNIPEEVMQIDEAIKWCMSHHLPEWSQPTWRMHRCGYRMLVERLSKAGKISVEKADSLKNSMSSASGLTRKQRVKKSSSRRKKVVLPEHIESIEELVSNNDCKWGEALVIWLKAAIITGLRPNEWRTAELSEESDRIILRSENFKFNKQRSYAPHREIDLTETPEDLVNFVRQQIAIVKGMIDEGLMDSYYNGCASLLYWCNKKIWPRRKANITLYTGRHQFSANAKADKSVSDRERAALMGHKTTRTSMERYGRSRSGSKGLTPKLADESVLLKINDPGVKRAPQQKVGVKNK